MAGKTELAVKNNGRLPYILARTRHKALYQGRVYEKSDILFVKQKKAIT